MYYNCVLQNKTVKEMIKKRKITTFERDTLSNQILIKLGYLHKSGKCRLSMNLSKYINQLIHNQSKENLDELHIEHEKIMLRADQKERDDIELRMDSRVRSIKEHKKKIRGNQK